MNDPDLYLPDPEVLLRDGSLLSASQLAQLFHRKGMSREEQGIYLAHLLCSVPLTGVYSGAAQIIMTVVGASEDISTSFAARLRNFPSGSRAQRFLDDNGYFGAKCVLWSWSSDAYDPRAVAILVKHFVAGLGPETFRILLDARRSALQLDSAAAVVKFNKTLAAMRNSIPSDGIAEIIGGSVQFQQRTAAHQEWKNAAQRAVGRCRLEPSLVALDELDAATRALFEIDPENAVVELLEGLSAVAGVNREVSNEANRRMDVELERLAAQVESGSPLDGQVI